MSHTTQIVQASKQLIAAADAGAWLAAHGHAGCSRQAIADAVRRGTLAPAQTILVGGRHHHFFTPARLEAYARGAKKYAKKSSTIP